LGKAGIPVVEFPKLGSLLSLRGAYQMLRLAHFIRQNKFDVVHAHDLWANLMAVPAARIARAPVVLSSQRDLGHLFWYTPFRRKVIAVIHRWSSRVIANSGAVREMLVNNFCVPERQVQIVRNSVDCERFAMARGNRRKICPSLDAKARLVAVVANMHSSVKGHHELIEAARIVCNVIPETCFVLVGDGEERPAIEEHATMAGVREHFIFLGRRADVPEVLACCELSVLASRAEGFPNVVLESMAAGLPVVATQVGGTPEIIEDGQSGLVVPPRDHQALAEAILRVLRDPILAGNFSQAGRQRVRTHFTFARLVGETEQLYATAPLERATEPCAG
jgi:glycosyltransferase involved in cell wall biosynthesis